MAVTLVLDRLQNGHTSHINVEFPFRLVTRESCREIL